MELYHSSTGTVGRLVFPIKQILGGLIMPLPVVLFLLTAGLVLLWATSRQLLGRSLILTGILLLFLVSLPAVGDRLILPLEEEYPHIIEPESVNSEVEWIVVLGHGAGFHPEVQPHARLSGEALFRVLEGVRLHRALPGTRLLFTGYGPVEGFSSAQANADVALDLGVSEEFVEVDPGPRDTGEEAEAARARIDPGEPFILVTSAAHLPRAVLHFRGRGLDPIPAPAQRYSLDQPRSLRGNFPSGGGVHMIERAVHERVGILWGRITGVF